MCWELEEPALNSAICGAISSMQQQGGCWMYLLFPGLDLSYYLLQISQKLYALN